MRSALSAAAEMTVTVEEAWSEVQRELKVRERCFDDWVKAGKLSWADARDRYGRMKAAAEILETAAELNPGRRVALTPSAPTTTAADAATNG